MERSPRSRPRGALCLALAALLVAACRGPEERRREAEERRQETLVMLRELIEQGTLRPVQSMEEAFAGIEPDMGATPEELHPPAAPEAAPSGESESAPPATPPFNPWAEFGPRILWDAERGLVTKPYPLPASMSDRVMHLLTQYGRFPLWNPETGPQGPATVRLDLRKGFDREVFAKDLRGSLADDGKPLELADWLVVTASPELLREVEYLLDTFIASPPQIEIESKIVEWVTDDSFDMGTALSVDTPDGVFFRSFDFDFPNSTGNTEFSATVGAIHDGATYSALIELLATYDNISIVSRPKIAVREGGKAQIVSTQRIPYVEIKSINNSGGFNTGLNYINVGVELYVTPRVVGTGTIALEIDVAASQPLGDAITVTTATGELITTPTTSRRSSHTLVYLKPGQAVIIGGLTAERTVEEQRKVPLLGDLPGLGLLFRSTLRRRQQSQVLFFLRPRLLEGADLAREL